MVSVAPMKSNTVARRMRISSQYRDTLKRSPMAATARNNKAGAMVMMAESMWNIG